MNIAHLYSKTKQKVKFISDLCNLNTLFLCFCETYLKDDILDSEIQIPDFSLIRCDRKARAGGGVCVLYCIVLYCIMRPYTDGPIGPLSYRHSSGVVRNPHSTLAE